MPLKPLPEAPRPRRRRRARHRRCSNLVAISRLAGSGEGFRRFRRPEATHREQRVAVSHLQLGQSLPLRGLRFDLGGLRERRKKHLRLGDLGHFGGGRVSPPPFGRGVRSEGIGGFVGCGSTFIPAWWFTEEALHPAPSKPKSPITMAQLPPECQTVVLEKCRSDALPGFGPIGVNITLASWNHL